MKNPLMNFVRVSLIVATLALSGHTKAQSSYPTKPLRLVANTPVGPDVYVRMLGTRLADQMGQPVVVENRTGVGGALAAQAVSGAPSDGYTLLIQFVGILIAKQVDPRLAFDPVEDFVQVAKIYDRGASVLVVRADSAAKNLEDLVAQAKASPGKLSYGSSGIGGAPHLAVQLILKITSTQALHVPFKSTAEFYQALLRGDVDFGIFATTSASTQIKAGKVRALVVTTSARTKDLPDVLTLRDVLKNDLLVMENWTGLAAPVKTPAEIVRRLNAETIKALTDPGLRKVIEAAGNEPAAAESPEQYSAFVRRENDKWREIVKVSGVKPD